MLQKAWLLVPTPFGAHEAYETITEMYQDLLSDFSSQPQSNSAMRAKLDNIESTGMQFIQRAGLDSRVGATRYRN